MPDSLSASVGSATMKWLWSVAVASQIAAAYARITPAPFVELLAPDAVVESDVNNDHCTTVIAGKLVCLDVCVYLYENFVY